jgi:hypothetical protein
VRARAGGEENGESGGTGSKREWFAFLSPLLLVLQPCTATTGVAELFEKTLQTSTGGSPSSSSLPFFIYSSFTLSLSHATLPPTTRSSATTDHSTSFPCRPSFTPASSAYQCSSTSSSFDLRKRRCRPRQVSPTPPPVRSSFRAPIFVTVQCFLVNRPRAAVRMPCSLSPFSSLPSPPCRVHQQFDKASLDHAHCIWRSSPHPADHNSNQRN